ncbi:MAG: RloB domain-containing protein [Ruminiclostridium sp.]|nr:RloB domain-containing protein [Ruminiclostridium sp.]
MAQMKENRKYYFTVEGECEKWYLQWLQRKINTEPASIYKVTLDCPIQKDPVKYAKRLIVTNKTNITHVFDYESNEEVHTMQFQTTLDRMKKAQSLGKEIKYHNGYSNFTFELWMILHKVDCNGTFTHRKQYITPINRAYEENFEDLDQYKHEANFKRVLGKLNLADVKRAIEQAKTIMQKNKENDYILQQYKKFPYYKENPSLYIWESIEKILKECELI